MCGRGRRCGRGTRRSMRAITWQAQHIRPGGRRGHLGPRRGAQVDGGAALGVAAERGVVLQAVAGAVDLHGQARGEAGHVAPGQRVAHLHASAQRLPRVLRLPATTCVPPAATFISLCPCLTVKHMRLWIPGHTQGPPAASAALPHQLHALHMQAAGTRHCQPGYFGGETWTRWAPAGARPSPRCCAGWPAQTCGAPRTTPCRLRAPTSWRSARRGSGSKQAR